MGIESISRSQKTKRLLVVTAICCVILVSSVAIVDVTSAGYEYDISEPSFSHGFPETIYFSNISERYTSNIFSFIAVLPANHSGHHHIIPREISLLFWFRDASDGTDLSTFIDAVLYLRRNGTFSISLLDHGLVDKSDSGWYAPSLIRVIFNDRPDATIVEFGLELKLLLVNIFGDDFNGHELNVQLEMNVTYSRWWYVLSVSPSHQTVQYIFNLPDDGIATILSLEDGLP